MNKCVAPITEKEIGNFLSKLRRGKAPDVDGITNEMIKFKEGKDAVFPKAIMGMEYYPSCWKNAIIVTAYKKGDIRDMSNYRPISLLSCLSKVFSGILTAESNGVFTNEQGGPRKFRDNIKLI